jgi:hypothetical protein
MSEKMGRQCERILPRFPPLDLHLTTAQNILATLEKRQKLQEENVLYVCQAGASVITNCINNKMSSLLST